MILVLIVPVPGYCLFSTLHISDDNSMNRVKRAMDPMIKGMSNKFYIINGNRGFNAMFINVRWA